MRRVALVALAGVLLTVLLMAIIKPWAHGDSGGVVDGAHGIIDCVKHARFTHCDRLPNGQETTATATQGFVAGNVNDFPLLQYFPAVALQAVGVSHHATLLALIILNALALIGIVALSWYTAARVAPPSWPPVLAATLIASPLLWYGIAGYGEALAGLTIVVAAAAVALRTRPGLIALACAVACISKETHPPFVFIIGALTGLAIATTALEARRVAVAVAIGCGVGIAINTAFNIFRFGSLLNTSYLTSTFRTPDVATSTRQFAALWLSPNGGLVWWWPAALGLLLLLAIGASSPRARREFGARGAFAGWALLALLAFDLAGLAGWWSPFGWPTFAPRLSLPLIPALLLAAVATSARRADTTLRRALQRPWFWIAAAGSMLLAVPQIGALFSRTPYAPMFRHNLACRGVNYVTQRAAFFRCSNHRAWSQPFILVHDGHEAFMSLLSVLAAACFVGALVSLLLYARSRALDGATEERRELVGS